MNIFQFPKRCSCPQAVTALFVALFFFSLLPFASALEVHHVFSEIDHDGHEHSDFDLCQWVQVNNGNGSIAFDHVEIDIALQVNQEQCFASNPVYSSVVLTSQDSRGPPLFF